MKYDLHVHTYYSDGLLSPKEVVDEAIKRGLDGIAITDHDTVLGLDEAINYTKEFENFNVIPGIELSCIYEGDEVHLLGYFIDYKDERILEVTKKLMDHRKLRGTRIVEKLRDLNIFLDIEKIKSKSDTDFIGRVAIARQMIEQGYVSSIQEAFDRYLNPGMPAYVERYKISVKDAINLIKEVKGIPVLAHPGLLKDDRIIYYCIDKGIEGMECIHSKYSLNDIRRLKAIAKKHNLIITAGSDCHGERNNGDLLLGRYFIDLKTIPKMKERIR
ncbi:MAG: PHP domain-containing protein [Tissierellia bacterium]|nr:PHP domain-containing protein [Tissierellia bacterium]